MKSKLQRLQSLLGQAFLPGRAPGVTAAKILASMPEAVYLTDPAGTILYANPAFAELTGYAVDEAVGQSVRIMESGRHPAEFYAGLWDTVNSGEVWRGEIVNRARDGSEYATVLSITPITGESGEIAYFIAVQRDITQQRALLEEIRKRTREHEELQSQLALSERGFRSIFEDSVDGIYQTTIDGRVITANPALVQMLNYDSLDDLKRVNIAEAVHLSPEDRERFVSKLLGEGVIRAEEQPLRRKDGSVILAQENARVVRDEKGQPLYFEGSLTDVTQKRSMERQLIQAQRMESVAKLAAVIAHDFNNLLTGIMGYVSLLLERSAGNPESQEMLQQILKTSERAADLTQKLLAFSRQAVTRAVPVNISSMIEGLGAFLKRSVESNITIDMRLDASVPAVQADPAHVRQVLIGLVQNSSEAMSGGGRIVIETGTVLFGSEFARTHAWAREGRFVVMRVRDSGKGMESETLKHAFEPFFTTKDPVPGKGLGLSMAYGIVKNHNGLIDIESEPGKGCTVSVYFPVIDRAGITLPTSIGVPVMAKTAVLLVDDEAVLRDLGTIALARAGYHVLTACDGDEALRLYAEHEKEIGCVVLDLTMPGKTGREVMDELVSRYRDCRILLSSGYSLDVTMKSLSGRHGFEFLQKPYRSEQLVERVRRMMSGGTTAPEEPPAPGWAGPA